MKSKGISSLVFIIPGTVAVILVAGVFGYKLYSEQSATRAKASEVPLEPVTLQDKVTKPKTGYGAMKLPTPTPTVIPTPTITATGSTAPVGTSASELESALKTTEDDGGEAEIKELETDVLKL